MKTLSALLVGGVLTLGVAIAKDTPKPTTSATPASQTKTKKHHNHKKTAKTTTTTPAKAAPVTVAHKK